MENSIALEPHGKVLADDMSIEEVYEYIDELHDEIMRLKQKVYVLENTMRIAGVRNINEHN